MPVEATDVSTLKRQRPHVGEIADWPAQQSISLLWDRVYALQEQLTAAQSTIQTLVAATNANETAVQKAQTTADGAMAIAQQPGPDGTTDVGGDTGGGGGELPGGGDGGKAAEGFAAGLPTGHDSGGSLTALRAGQILGGTANEWASLGNAEASQAARDAHQEEFLLRMIWHLNNAGFQAGRQQNPSLAISGDKLTVIVDGVLRAYDMFSGPPFNQPLDVHCIEVGPPVQIADPGTPD